MTKRPTRETIARRFAAHDARLAAQPPADRPETLDDLLVGLDPEEMRRVLADWMGDRPIRFADPKEAMASALRIMEENAEALRLMASYDEDDEALRLMADK